MVPDASIPLGPSSPATQQAKSDVAQPSASLKSKLKASAGQNFPQANPLIQAAIDATNTLDRRQQELVRTVDPDQQRDVLRKLDQAFTNGTPVDVDCTLPDDPRELANVTKISITAVPGTVRGNPNGLVIQVRDATP